jgi:hypothetical protein
MDMNIKTAIMAWKASEPILKKIWCAIRKRQDEKRRKD